MIFRSYIALPPEPEVSDFARREVEVKINDNPDVSEVIHIVKDQKDFTVDGKPGDTLHLVLRDFDRSNNGSDPSDVFDLFVVDNVGPPKPGAMHVLRVEQIDDGVPLPIALTLTAEPKSGPAPLTVKFTTNLPVGSFDSGAGFQTGTMPSEFTYNTPGEYSAVVTNDDGTAFASINVGRVIDTAATTKINPTQAVDLSKM